MKYICPLLSVEDIQVSRDFYEKILGQEVKYEHGKNVTFEGDFVIHEKAHFQELLGDKEIVQGSNSFELYFESDEFNKLMESITENNVELVHELKEQPWRQQVIRFYDPDQHIIEVGESMNHLCERLRKEGHTESEVQELTGLPQEFVEFVFSMNDE
jgi:catechol 2,3-dioxygenase-like lactoylglutathione lyase family enzyme